MSEHNKKPNRYSISVSGKTYDRLRAVVTQGSLASFINDIMGSALDDPAISARVLAMCRQQGPVEP